MKRIASLFLSFSCLVSAVAAQAAPVPNITAVPQTHKAYSTANIAFNGSNLGLITTVKLDGVSIPIVRTTANRLVVGPVPQKDPGFGQIEAIYDRGTLLRTLPLLPTLTGVRRYTHVNLVLSNGDTGTYVLRFAYTTLGAPAVDQGIYGKRYLGLFSSALAAGVFADANPLALSNILIPSQVGLIGSPLKLQAECFAANTGVTAYTNLVSVPGYGQHQ